MAYPFVTETQYPSEAQATNEPFAGRAPDTLAAYAVPPESTFQSWLEPGEPSLRPAAAASDSAYYSDMSQPYQSLPSNSPSMTSHGALNPVNMADFGNSGMMIGDGCGRGSHANGSLQEYQEKGKGKANAMFMAGGPEGYRG